MIQTTLRALTIKERNELLDQIALYTKTPGQNLPLNALGLVQAWYGFLYGCTVGFLLLLLGQPVAIAWVCVAITVGIAVVFHASKALPAVNDTDYVSNLLSTLRRDAIEEITVVASGVVAVRDTEKDDADYVEGYFFDIGNNQVFFLWDEYLPFSEETNQVSLPSVFSLTRHPVSGDILTSIPAGPDFFVSRTSYFNANFEFDIENGAVFSDVSLETLEQDLPDYFDGNKWE